MLQTEKCNFLTSNFAIKRSYIQHLIQAAAAAYTSIESFSQSENFVENLFGNWFLTNDKRFMWSVFINCYKVQYVYGRMAWQLLQGERRKDWLLWLECVRDSYIRWKSIIFETSRNFNSFFLPAAKWHALSVVHVCVCVCAEEVGFDLMNPKLHITRDGFGYVFSGVPWIERNNNEQIRRIMPTRKIRFANKIAFHFVLTKLFLFSMSLCLLVYLSLVFEKVTHFSNQ